MNHLANSLTKTFGVEFKTAPAPARLEVWDDLASERPVAYRLFWVKPGETVGSPAVGYCSPGGSYRTIREAIADGEKRFGETAVRVR